MGCIRAALFSTQVQEPLHCSLERCVGFKSCYYCTPFLQGRDLCYMGSSILRAPEASRSSLLTRADLQDAVPVVQAEVLSAINWNALKDSQVSQNAEASVPSAPPWHRNSCRWPPSGGR